MIDIPNIPGIPGIPDGLKIDIRRQAGPGADLWLTRLPELVERHCAEWHLAIVGAPMHGARGLVLPVDRGAQKLALKVAWPDKITSDEYRALSAWDGRGMVRLIDSRPETGAALLERLDASRPLSSIPIDEAIVIAGDLIAMLAVDTGMRFPTMAERTADIYTTLRPRWEATGRPFSPRLLDRVQEQAIQLGQGGRRTLVNWDLHYDNVLAGERLPWIAIDPMPLLGDPELGLAPLFWTRLEGIEDPARLRYLFDSLIDRAGLERKLADAWMLVRLADYWLWALGVGLTIDPERCRTLIDWLGY